MRRRKRRKQRKIIIISSLILLFIITVGYAAFQTNINITAKGNIKVLFQKVKFKTQLLENNTFENGISNWDKYGCSSGGYEVSSTVKYNGYNSMRVFENSGSQVSCWNGIAQKLNRSYDTTKTYETSAYVYRDSTSTYGDLNNKIRIYHNMLKDGASVSGWLYMNNSKSSAIEITKNRLIDKTWVYIEDFNKGIISGVKGDAIWGYRFDYSATAVRDSASSVWIALPKFFEVEEKEIRKFSKIGQLPSANKAGYTFAGWYTEESGGEKIDENFKVTEDIILYARFTKN